MSGGKKIWVCPIAGRQAEVAKLKKLLAGLDAELVCEDKQSLQDYEECVRAADVVVILICPESIDDPTIKAIVAMASHLAKRIVGIWLDEEAEGEVPPFIERDGDAVTIMSAGALRKAVIESEPVWLAPDGKPRAPQKVPRHKGH